MPFILNKRFILKLSIFLFVYYFYLQDLFIVFIADLLKIKDIPEPLFVLLHQGFLLVLTVFLFGIYKNEIWKKISPNPFRWKSITKIVVGLFLLAVVLQFLASFGSVLIPSFSEQTMDKAVKQQWGFFEKTFINDYITYFLAVFTVVIISPIFEELFIRGVLYNALKSKFNLVLSLLLSSLIFAIAHLNPILIFHALIFGVVLTIIYEKTKNIWYPILFHMIGNSIPFWIPIVFWVFRR